MSSPQTTLVFSNGQASSLIPIVLFAAISLTAILAVFVRYSWDPLMTLLRRRRSSESPHHSRAFFHTQLGAHIASLMLCNALSSISFIIDAQWASAKAVTQGTLCNTQGILTQIGDTGGAYFTGAIAIHAFNTLVLRNKLPGWICFGAIVLGWLIAILLAATPSWIRKDIGIFGPVYGIQELSCGISRNWPLLSTGLHLIPLLVGSIVSVLFFTLVFLVLRGTLTIKNGIKIKLNRTNRWSMSSVTTVEYQRFIAAVARSMLWYPFAYNILLLPHIIVNLTRSSGIKVPFEANVFANVTASLLGTANALILCNTLRILRPFLEGSLTVNGGIASKKGKDADMESFFAGVKSPMGFSPSPVTPKNPEKAFVLKTESKREWAPPPRTVSNPIATVGDTVARGISRVSRTVSLKRKDSHSKPVINPATIARSITPVAELNAMITVPEPAVRKNTLPATPRLPGASPSLPAPPRDTRSPVIRRPTLQADSPTEAPFTTISLNTPEPPKKSAAALAPKRTPSTTTSRHTSHRTSASDSLLSMYLSRTPEQEEMDKPVPPPKPLPVKSRPQPMPFSARPPMSQNSLAPSPLPTLRSARVPTNVSYGMAPDKQSFASNEWVDRVRRGAPSPSPMTATTVKAERRRSRSLDLTAATATIPRTPALQTARTPIYGNSLTAGTPRRDASLNTVSARTPTFGRRLPPTPSRTGSTTPGGYNYL
ncbi:hypothetical protein C8Q80DRAFT_1269678 [Daedaleopsis nitida]|nr:hypothetical protein C8Q80DRAFT_1269678 [Daedaleopsis nitida]